MERTSESNKPADKAGRQHWRIKQAESPSLFGDPHQDDPADPLAPGKAQVETVEPDDQALTDQVDDQEASGK